MDLFTELPKPINRADAAALAVSADLVPSMTGCGRVRNGWGTAPAHYRDDGEDFRRHPSRRGDWLYYPDGRRERVK